jgi:3-oxoacyl-[acyl-carrier protein] reductase
LRLKKRKTQMNIVVTGTSRGIGYEIVKLLSEDPSNSVFAVSRNKEKLEQLKRECLAINSSSVIIPVPCDLNKENDIKNLAACIKNEGAKVDILINNAGAIINKPFMEISAEDLNYVYNVNVFSVFRTIQEVLPYMNQVKRSHIVNISSMGGFQGSAKFAGLSAYSSGKAAVANLTECLAEEFKEKNTAFNCLALGAAQTEMLNEAFPGYKAPLTARQMAEFVADFSLKAHHYINGKIIPVSMSTP